MKSLILSLFVLITFQFSVAQNNADEIAIHKIVETMADGWTAGDGAQFASVFAEGHDYIVWNGVYMKNFSVAQNADSHQGIFNTIYKNTKQYMTVDKIKFLREDLALIHVFAAVVKQGEGRPKDPQVLWTGILEKKEGQWKIISFHNLDLELLENEEMRKGAPVPPEVMYANWYAKG